MKTLQEGEAILKKHYTLQQKVVDESGVKMDMLWVSRKYIHSQDVFKISQYLIENDEVLKKLDNKYKLYGELSALLHDIGRAYEVGDMKDKVKPHGYYGADIILKQVEKENNPFILIPVKYHGDLKAEENARKELEEIDNLSDEEKEIVIMLLKLVMDSDKLANFKMFKKFDKKYFNSIGLDEKPYISDECFESFKNRELVSLKDRKTVLDKILLTICWIYDLNYQASIDLVKKEKHLEDYLNLFEKYIDNNQKTKDTENKINFIKQQLIEDNFI